MQWSFKILGSPEVRVLIRQRSCIELYYFFFKNLQFAVIEHSLFFGCPHFQSCLFRTETPGLGLPENN